MDVCKFTEHTPERDDFGRNICTVCGVHINEPPAVVVRTLCTEGHDETRTVTEEAYDATYVGETPFCPRCLRLTTTWVTRSRG